MDVAHGRVACILTDKDSVFLVFIEPLRFGQQFLPHSHGLFGLLRGNTVLRAVIGEGQRKRRHQSNDRQHDPCGQFLIHSLFLQAGLLPLRKAPD